MRPSTWCLIRATFILLGLLLIVPLPGAEAAERSGAPPVDPDRERIFQFFVPSQAPKASAQSGAYLWIPPATPHIRAVMVGIHNGLPVNILQHPAIRAVCRRHGIAQILLTPNGSEIGPVMLKELNYDITDETKTAVYDHYLRALAEVAGHPELLTTPIVPLAHSAYASFPFDAAMRRPEQCLAAIPIKAGVPNQYAFYAVGGKAKAPDATLALRHVPLLFVDSAGQETVPGRWKSSPYPQVFEPNFIGNYRRDRQDNPGTDYEPRNELAGACWDMLSGHFDLLERNYRFIATWLDAIATARLPPQAGAPLRNLTLRDGWLMDPRVPRSGTLGDALGADYALPARYQEFRGDRSRALWFPTEQLARELLTLQCEIATRVIEVFTVLDPGGQPISLSESPMAVMPEPFGLVHGLGRITLTTHHFVTPPAICTVQTRDHGKRPDDLHEMGNPLFPGKTTLPVSGLALRCDPNGGPLAVIGQEQVTDARGVSETRFTLQLTRDRLAPEAGFQMFFLRLCHDGDERFLPTGRTVQIAWSLTNGKDAKDQTLTFPPLTDVPLTAPVVHLGATSSSGLPVAYFVVQGPGVIRDGDFVPAEIPLGTSRPISVTIGAYQVGDFRPSGGTKPTASSYQTFHLVP